MENKEDNKDNKKNNSSISILITLLVFALLGAGYLFYSNMQLKDQLADCSSMKQDVKQERDRVVGNLENMLVKYDSLDTDNDSIKTQLEEEKARVKELITQAKNNEWTIYKLRKEASTLRDIMKGYVKTIDSLNTENIELRAKNAEVTQKLTETEKRNENLETEKTELQEKVKIGAKLNALNMISFAQRSNIMGTMKETSRAGRAEKIKTCFTLEKNDIAKEGERNVYVRIISPNGQVLAERTDESNMFEFDGTKGLYTVKKIVYYENRELDVCMFWDVKDELDEGIYTIEAYADKMKIGSTTFELK
jgi:predicted  nucleic acid-binding Zn-ribbon protein